MIEIGREQEWKRQFHELKERLNRKKNFVCCMYCDIIYNAGIITNEEFVI